MRKIAVIPGDGIGIEVIKGAIQVLKKSRSIQIGDQRSLLKKD